MWIRLPGWVRSCSVRGAYELGEDPTLSAATNWRPSIGTGVLKPRMISGAATCEYGGPGRGGQSGDCAERSQLRCRQSAFSHEVVDRLAELQGTGLPTSGVAVGHQLPDLAVAVSDPLRDLLGGQARRFERPAHSHAGTLDGLELLVTVPEARCTFFSQPGEPDTGCHGPLRPCGRQGSWGEHNCGPTQASWACARRCCRTVSLHLGPTAQRPQSPVSWCTKRRNNQHPQPRTQWCTKSCTD